MFIRPYGTLISRGPGIPVMNRWAIVTASLRDDGPADSVTDPAIPGAVEHHEGTHAASRPPMFSRGSGYFRGSSLTTWYNKA